MMMAYRYDRCGDSGFSLQSADGEEQPEDNLVQEDFTELQIAEYTVFLFALDTYVRYLVETTGKDGILDDVAVHGMRLARFVETQHSETIRGFFEQHLPNVTLQRMVQRGFRLRPNADGIGQRALQLRTALSRGGTTTMRAVFQSQKAVLALRAAINAAMIDDADAALDKFAVITMRNARLRDWIDTAAKTAGSGAPPGAVAAATDGVGETATQVAEKTMTSSGQTGSIASAEASEARNLILQKVQAEAKVTAQKALDQAKEPDVAPTRSDVVAIATAAAVAATSDPSNNRNIPPSLAFLSEENRAVALMGGRVRVSAGAGSGKSTTLCARVAYLVQEKAVDPSTILVTSFNTKAAKELKTKIAKAVGSESADKMTIGTMHSIFLTFISRYGTPAQKGMFLGRSVDKATGKSRVGTRILKDSQIMRPVFKAWEKCFPQQKDARGEKLPFPEAQLWKYPPKPRRMRAYMNKFQGAGWTVTQAQDWARASREPEHIQAAVFYEFYEGFKGAFGPSWSPRACANITRTQEYTDVSTRVRGGAARGGDFSDMLTVFRNIIRDNPDARKVLQEQYQHVKIDECQDLNPVQTEAFLTLAQGIQADDTKKSIWMVGDENQCVAVDTLISTPSGHKVRAGDLKAGDAVLAYRNGDVVSQRVAHVLPSAWTHGIKLTTTSGKTLTVSPNHKIWASSPELSEGQKLVYLMYRPDLGFRVGVTNKCEGGYNPFGGRTLQEHAERLWVLAVTDDNEEALLLEQSFSLKYGIPMSVFCGAERGINQDRLNRIFAEFGKNGARLLEDMHLSFELPSWLSTSYTRGSKHRYTIQMVAHASKGTQVALEWTGRELDDKLGDVHFTREANEHNRIRKFFTNYRQALVFAEDLKRKTGACLRRRISTIEEPLPLITAGGLMPGMSVLVNGPCGVERERIVGIEKVAGSFIDLDVDDASNFFGGDILSHNSIYAFRGADPEQFRGLDQHGFKTGYMKTNRRSLPEIVETANRLIAHNENQMMTQNPLPDKPRGAASIVMSIPDDNTSAAVTFANRVKEAQLEGKPLDQYAVLARTNKELHNFETACIIRGTPYVRKGASSFLAAPEAKTFMSFIDLASSNDPSRLAAGLAEALVATKRLRSTGFKPELVEEAIHRAMERYANGKGTQAKDVNPIGAALVDPNFRTILAQSLSTRELSPYIAEKDAETIYGLINEIAEIRTKASKRETPEGMPYKTSDLFADILTIKCTERAPDESGTWVEREKTLKEKLVQQLKFADLDKDEEIEDEEAVEGDEPLGAISFFKEMLKPDPTEPDLDPENPLDFRLRVDRYKQRAKELRIDPNEWEKKNPGVKPPGVYLGTVHSVKGAEWEDVTVLMPVGTFPFSPMPRKTKEDECPEVPLFSSAVEMEGERRLGYVALTRAVKNLSVVCPYEAVLARLPRGAPSPPREAAISQFVREAELHVGENVKPTAATGPSLNAIAEEVGDESTDPVKTAYVYGREMFVACDCGDDPFAPAPVDAPVDVDAWRE